MNNHCEMRSEDALSSQPTSAGNRKSLECIARTAGMALLSLLMIATLPVAALAQWQPTKPIDFIVMAGKGGGADKAVRFLSKIMAEKNLVNVPVNVVNMSGDSGGKAMKFLKSRSGDDHSIMFTLNSFYTTPLRRPELGVDISTFTPIARLAEDVFILWVHSDNAKINTIEDFVKAARKKGKDWVMAGTGKGAEDNLITDFLNATYKLSMSYKPMKGGGAVAKELAEKRADSTVNNPSEQAKYYPKGITKPIVVFTPKRLPQYNRTPALRETGMDFHYFMQRSVVGAPAMSAGAVQFYQRLFTQLFNGSDWQAYRKKNSLRGKLLTGAALRKYWLAGREKHARWQMALDIMLQR